MRRRYLVAYDIRDDKRLRRVHLVCRTYGSPLQYSVFICDLNARELIACRAALEDEMILSRDSTVIIDLGEARGRGSECVEFVGYRPWSPPQSGEARIL